MESSRSCRSGQQVGQRCPPISEVLCSAELCAFERGYCKLGFKVSAVTVISRSHIDFGLNRYFYNSWRPVTAIQKPGIWLPSGLDVSNSSWTPLLAPTPNHQDYLSTHATFGGAGAAVIAAFNGGDKVDVLLSSNVTVDNIGVITRRITNLTAAAVENGDSRIFGGIHFQFASDIGNAIGKKVALATLDVFDEKWDDF